MPSRARCVGLLRLEAAGGPVGGGSGGHASSFVSFSPGEEPTANEDDGVAAASPFSERARRRLMAMATNAVRTVARDEQNREQTNCKINKASKLKTLLSGFWYY